jgi:hypothetical protein
MSAVKMQQRPGGTSGKDWTIKNDGEAGNDEGTA